MSNGASFEEFAASSGPRLHRLAYLLSKDDASAEDLVQEALIKVYVRWARLRSGVPEAYARKVIINAQKSSYRRRARMREDLVGSPPERAVVTDAESRVDDRLSLRQALAGLPAGRRLIVVLRYYEDMAEDEVAREVGCSVGTVKSQASRGLATLRASLSSSVEPPVPGQFWRNDARI